MTPVFWSIGHLCNRLSSSLFLGFSQRVSIFTFFIEGQLDRLSTFNQSVFIHKFQCVHCNRSTTSFLGSGILCAFLLVHFFRETKKERTPLVFFVATESTSDISCQKCQGQELER